MPCHDGREEECSKEEAQRTRGLAVGLCIACDILRVRDDGVPQVLLAWYEAHTEADRAREEYSRTMREADIERSALRKEGLVMGFQHPTLVRLARAASFKHAAEDRERAQSIKLSGLKPE